MLFTTLLAILGLVHTCRALPSVRDATPPVQLVYQFDTSISPENIILRSNGQMLLTSLTTAQIFQLDPNGDSSQNATVVHTFTGYGGVSGIVELETDVFAVTVGGFSATTGSVPGTWGAWTVDLRKYQAPAYDLSNVKVQQMVASPTVDFMNGLALINAEKGLLATADSYLATIWLLNLLDNTTQALVVSSDLEGIYGTSDPDSEYGVNGLDMRGDRLYFTTTGLDLFGYLPVDLDTGMSAGDIVKVFNATHHLDDFRFSSSGYAYMTTLDTPNGGIQRRSPYAPVGAGGAELVISKNNTNSVLLQEGTDKCTVVFTAATNAQVLRSTLSGPC